MIYLGWAGGEPAGGPGEGPWSDVFELAPGLWLFDSEATRSQVYHALKWALPRGAPVLVAPLHEEPKVLHLATGAKAWLRAHPPRPAGAD